MERNKMLQVLVPAAAAAGVVLLVGVLIGMSDWSGPPASGKDAGKGKGAAAAGGDDAGMTDALPPLDAAEWKDAPGGMKQWDVKEGDGDPCPRGAAVTIHYTGWTKDGKVFDSSRKALATRPGVTGEPATFPLGNLIKGWQEGIPGMKPGGVRRLKIPAELGYGKAGAGRDIPPRADLVFEVKLLAAK